MHAGLPDDSGSDWTEAAARRKAYQWHKRHFPNNHESAALFYADKFWQRHLAEVQSAASAAARFYEERKRFRLN